MNKNFEAAYKKRKSGKLIWLICTAISEKEANNKMDLYIFQHYGRGYTRYAGSLPIKNK